MKKKLYKASFFMMQTYMSSFIKIGNWQRTRIVTFHQRLLVPQTASLTCCKQFSIGKMNNSATIRSNLIQPAR